MGKGRHLQNQNDDNSSEKDFQDADSKETKKANEIDAVPLEGSADHRSHQDDPKRKKHFSNQNRRPFKNRSDQGNPGNQKPSRPEPSQNQNFSGQSSPYSESYVSMGERYQKQRSGYGADQGYGMEDQTEEERENFGNSIHYQGPGVDVRFGTARDEGPQFAPWEGAHGYLLTHHEAKKPRQNNGGKANQGGRRHERGRPQQQAQGGHQNQQGQPASGQGPSQRNFKKKNRHKKARGQLHDIVCLECKIETQVPFKPIPGKPVYCKDCHKKILEKARAEKAQKPEESSRLVAEELSPAPSMVPPPEDSLT